jgi:hypothetical protein
MLQSRKVYAAERAESASGITMREAKCGIRSKEHDSNNGFELLSSAGIERAVFYDFSMF